MPAFLITLISKVSRKTGLGILDTRTGFRYLQIDQEEIKLFPFYSYRGISLFDQAIYLLTPHSIRIYNYRKLPAKPLFALNHEIRYYDWELTIAKSPNSGLVSILLSKRRNCIFVGNNSQCSVDQISLSGKFIKRYPLWEIAPDIFKVPNSYNPGFTYGMIRQLSELKDGSIYMTIANCNAGGKGKIINFDTGEPLLEGLNDPHGAIVSNNLYLLQDTLNGPCDKDPENGKLIAYRLAKEKKFQLKDIAWEKKLQNDTNTGNWNPQQLCGLAVSGDQIFCGACFLGCSELQIQPNRIVSFDTTTGRQLKSFELPDLVDFRNPLILGMTLLPDNWDIGIADRKITFFLKGKQIEAKKHINPLVQNHPETVEDIPKLESTDTLQSALEKKTKKDFLFGDRSVHIDNVSLCYRRTGQFLFSFNKSRRTEKKFWALKNISASFYEGETIGLIGRNGSGKSTLSMMISGVLKPDKGKIITKGKVQLLALGIGFRPQLTGRENVMISGTILGMARKDIKAQMKDIEEFAELGDFFDEPIRTYSAGMKSRLGFAVSTAVQPDILILDEVMSTGDAAFRQKANKRMEKMRSQTKTVIVVSHNPGQVKELCSRVLWLEQGRLLMDGPTEQILPIYTVFCKHPQQWLKDHPDIAMLIDARS